MIDKDKLAAALGIDKDEQAVLDAGSSHRFGCRCRVCLAWWKMMGPQDADEEGNGTDYGPFTAEEVRNAPSAED